MSVRLAKIAVALLYAATVIAVAKEFSGHHGLTAHREPPERPPQTIQSGLVSGVRRIVIRAERSGQRLLDRPHQLVAAPGLPICPMVLGLVVVDTSAHEHPTKHESVTVRRRGKWPFWKEPMAVSVRHRLTCHSPPEGCRLGHRPRLVRRGADQVIII